MDFNYGTSTRSFNWGSNSSRIQGDRRWNPLDLVLVILLMIVSGVLSFYDLGDRTAPQTFWKPAQVGETFIVDFGKIRPVDRLNMYEGPAGRGETRIEYSTDGQHWILYTEIKHEINRVFTWKLEEKSVEARYMRFTAQKTGYRLYEASFFTKDITSVAIPVVDVITSKQIQSSEGSGAEVFDEQEWAPYRPDYRNGMYFDEIYHGRTAYEFVEGMQPYENTHPHLGKDILALGVKWFGMTPFGWRFMAAVFGTIMVPIFYAIAKGMFMRTRYAFLAALLLVLEGFHLVHSRSANVDIFGVTFTMVMFYAMYRYGESQWQYGGFKRSLGWLTLGGIFFGLAASVKWNYLYGGAGLAILLLFALFRRRREARSKGDHFAKRLVLTLMACIVLYVAVPAGIYTVSYIPYFKATVAEDGIKDLWDDQKRMYEYHKGVKEEHPYGSKWYTWPLMLRPVWYYGGKDLAKGDAQSIAAMGNPVIWWGGLAAMLAAWWIGLRHRDRMVLMLTFAYMSFYVPWMVAPRSVTFLYHYFPMVPLLILFLIWMLRYLEERSYKGRRWTMAVVISAIALFIWFYPVYTGVTISREWMNVFIRWLPSWGF
ncbi:MAG: phospholipid carrier-dependent glycosyltransferase [Candidatus Cohnella colombiensis]|uniref:Polyprenol-phosphate-mannose--protein mannosyltransferase n=1 Tax=Candidatus Cohnella colombiensis TaxID=3121368 RepID=A0AA95JF88_9BACL|nr:MAG: phospholipid carrier-dependent glycosyltransferase [Cohnella sp.]